ncbi:MAG: hypothetical protein MJ052_01645 [Sphaerochaetaceae bacterium]|nr:hypothetical protein [Sphaerochaetaceae bacterium]
MKRYTVVFLAVIVLLFTAACSDDALKRQGERLSGLQNNVWGVKDEQTVEEVRRTSYNIVRDGTISTEKEDVESLIDALGNAANSEKKLDEVSEILSKKAPEGISLSLWEIVGRKGTSDSNTVWGRLDEAWRRAENNLRLREKIDEFLCFDRDNPTMGDCAAVAVLLNLAKHVQEVVQNIIADDGELKVSDIMTDPVFFDSYAALKVIDPKKYDCSSLLSDFLNK